MPPVRPYISILRYRNQTIFGLTNYMLMNDQKGRISIPVGPLYFKIGEMCNCRQQNYNGKIPK